MNAAYPIGLIGLGTMGEAMALTLVKAGTRLLVWNRTPAKAESFAAAGADVAREAAHVFAHCATVFLMLVDGEAIDTVLDRGGADEEAFACSRRLAREEGILAGVSSGAALHAALRLAARPECAGMLIVVMICDTGERYVSSALFGLD